MQTLFKSKSVPLKCKQSEFSSSILQGITDKTFEHAGYHQKLIFSSQNR